MKKNFFYFALAACVALCGVSCGSDDDDNGGKKDNTQKTTIAAPKYADKAVSVKINTPVQATTTEDAPMLTAFNITQGGKAVLEVKTPDNHKKYVAYDVVISEDGNTYTLAGNHGTIKKQVTKGTTISLVIEITIDIPGYGTLTYSTTSEAFENLVTTSSVIQTYVSRLWNVSSMTLDLDGEGVTSVFKTFTGGDLTKVREEAINHGAELSEAEKKEFERNVQFIDLSDGITIGYADGTCDKGDWNWASGQVNEFLVNLADDEMGNKFFNNDTKIIIEPNLDRCNLTLTTKDITKSNGKKYNASLTFTLTVAK